MNATPHEPRAPAVDEQRPDEPGCGRGDGGHVVHDQTAERERFDDRRRRVGAAQMAAPSTRRWRRNGRFSSSETDR